MGSEESEALLEMRKRILQIFRDFMTEITKLEELGNAGSRFLRGFQQGLGFFQSPPLNSSSKLIGTIIKNNETRRLKNYVEGGCFNCHDAAQSSKMIFTCLNGLHDHLTQARSVLDEIERLLDNATNTIETANKCSSSWDIENTEDGLLDVATDKVESVSSHPEGPETTDYAVLMAVVYSMVKQNHVMQEKIITSLSYKTSSEELESYNLMWTWQPYIKDEVLNQSWKLVS